MNWQLAYEAMTDIHISKILEAIADSKGVESDELEFVLADHLDFDAVELLAKHGNSTWRLEFELPDHIVTVTSEGEILVDNQLKQNVAST